MQKDLLNPAANLIYTPRSFVVGSGYVVSCMHTKKSIGEYIKDNNGKEGIELERAAPTNTELNDLPHIK